MQRAHNFPHQHPRSLRIASARVHLHVPEGHMDQPCLETEPPAGGGGIAQDTSLDGPGVELYVRYLEFQVAVRTWGDALERSIGAVLNAASGAMQLLDREAAAWEQQLIAAEELRKATDRYRRQIHGAPLRGDAQCASA